MINHNYNVQTKSVTRAVFTFLVLHNRLFDCGPVFSSAAQLQMQEVACMLMPIFSKTKNLSHALLGVIPRGLSTVI